MKIFSQSFLDFCRKLCYLKIVQNVEKNGFRLQLGPLGTLLSKNIEQEWWNNALMNSNDKIFPIKNYNIKKNQNVLSNYQELLQLCDNYVPFGIAEASHGNPKLFSMSNCTSSSDDLPPSIDNLTQVTHLTIQYFGSQKSSMIMFDKWERQRRTWWRKYLGDPSNISAKTSDTENGQNSSTIKILYKFPWGCDTIEEVSNLGSESFKEFRSETGIKFLENDGQEAATPIMYQCISSLDIATLVFMHDALQEKDGEKKNVMRFHPRLAPYKVTVAISDHSSDKTRFQNLAQYVIKELEKSRVMIFPNKDLQTSTSLKAQYSQFDELGIPFVVVLNEKTLQNGIALVRNRDTTLEEDIHVTEISSRLKKYLLHF